MRGRSSNLLALAAAAALIVAGLLWLNSKPEVDLCKRWQTAVRRQAELSASQRNARPERFITQAARVFAEDRPAGCALPD